MTHNPGDRRPTPGPEQPSADALEPAGMATPEAAHERAGRRGALTSLARTARARSVPPARERRRTGELLGERGRQERNPASATGGVPSNIPSSRSRLSHDRIRQVLPVRC